MYSIRSIPISRRGRSSRLTYRKYFPNRAYPGIPLVGGNRFPSNRAFPVSIDFLRRNSNALRGLLDAGVIEVLAHGRPMSFDRFDTLIASYKDPVNVSPVGDTEETPPPAGEGAEEESKATEEVPPADNGAGDLEASKADEEVQSSAAPPASEEKSEEKVEPGEPVESEVLEPLVAPEPPVEEPPVDLAPEPAEEAPKPKKKGKGKKAPKENAEDLRAMKKDSLILFLVEQGEQIEVLEKLKKADLLQQALSCLESGASD